MTDHEISQCDELSEAIIFLRSQLERTLSLNAEMLTALKDAWAVTEGQYPEIAAYLAATIAKAEGQ